MEFDELIRARFSVRKYQQKPVEDGKLQRVLEAGRIAPTGANKQPVRIYVLKSDETIQKVRALTPCAFDAPVVLLVTYDRDVEWKNPFNPGVSAGPQDASIVGTHMMLKATELGLGTCWVNYFDVDRVHEAFDLPKNETLLFMMPMGYAAEGAKPNPRHTDRLALSEAVREL
ncbi:MAG: nitroreductase family protein [Atopobiaceae bacterium]